MLSVDANLLLYCRVPDSPFGPGAVAFISSLQERGDVVISEFVLTELFVLVRNPKILAEPMSPGEAAEFIGRYRCHPRWRLVGFPPGSREIHDRLYETAARRQFARRRIYDVRIALTLQAFGVTDFATANVSDFEDLGFRRVWNPLEEDAV